MDPHHILGIRYNATQDEIKQAYRRLAMKWHPDRNQNSSESKERFYQAAQAYKILFERAPRESERDADAQGFEERGDDYAEDPGPNARYRDNGNGSQDEFADSVFWDVLLDYAIKLAQTGASEHDITLDIRRNGCSERLARVIASKAYNIHAHYTSSPDAGKQRKSRPDRTTFEEERLDGELFRAFLGPRSYVLGSRDAADYYLVVFRAFRRSLNRNPLSWISVNKRLMRILNFSILLFAVLLLAVYYYPGPSEYKLLPDKQLLQLPFLLLPLMFVWMLYRRLWGATLVLSLIYVATIVYYNSAVPRVVQHDLYALIPVVVAGFAPFVLAALFANVLYYLKAGRMLRMARGLFSNHLDQLVWIKNRSGTSASAAILFALIFSASLVHLVPRNWDYAGPVVLSDESLELEYNEARLEKARLKTSKARELFESAEAHFNASPPDYRQAEKAYSAAAANGSLLAAYKLGYMRYTGLGIEQNDVLAFDDFMQATRAPLAFQPHKLETTTRYLAESYNNLGIMYQDGLGTRKNLQRAAEMFRAAARFGSAGAARNLRQAQLRATGTGRRNLAYPEFE